MCCRKDNYHIRQTFIRINKKTSLPQKTVFKTDRLGI